MDMSEKEMEKNEFNVKNTPKFELGYYAASFRGHENYLIEIHTDQKHKALRLEIFQRIFYLN